MQRGEIWWANLPPPRGIRPVVLISREKAIERRNSVTVAMLTSTIRQLPVEVRIGPEDGLPRECVINTDVLMTLEKHELKERITRLSELKMVLLNKALRFALALN